MTSQTVLLHDLDTGQRSGFTVLRHTTALFQQYPYRMRLGDVVRRIFKEQYGYIEVYYCPWTMECLFAPQWMWWMEYVLRLRDSTARGWSVVWHLFSGAGSKAAPWPRWAELGWRYKG